MSNKAKAILIYSTVLVVGVFFFFWGLVKAKAFLAPLAVAVLLAMVILPVCRWFEKKGIKRGWASFFSDMIILLFFVLLAGVVAAQIKSLTEDWPQIKSRMQPKIVQLQEFIADKTGLSVQEQDQKIKQRTPLDLFSSGSQSSQGASRQEQGQQSSSAQNNEQDRSSQEQRGAQEQNKSKEQGQQQQNQNVEGRQEQAGGDQQQQQQQQPQQNQGEEGGQQDGGQQTAQSSQSEDGGGGNSMLSTAGSFLGQFFSFLGTFLLIFVYIFFFLLYRKKFKKSIMKIAPEDRRDRTKKVLTESASVAQNYLFGRLLLILFLAILYSIGLSVSGVKQAILISILAALLSLIPYIGNILGFFLAVGMALLSGSGLTGVIGVAITFAIAQFVESYILEPYIVGDKVDLNPVMVIIVVVLGNAVWGVIGMLIAIPVLGVAKVIFDHVPVLNPLGYLFGQEDIGDQEEDKDNLFNKTKRWALRKFNSD